MKYLITLLFAALSLNAVGQTNPNYNPDYDADGFISVNDVLGVLSTFGDTWDSGDVIVGCTYPSAVEYNPSANVDDGSCTFLPDCPCCINGISLIDECGVCGGDNTSCAGCDGVANSGLVNDECGVCGGSGIAEGDCDCEGNMFDVLGVCGGGCEGDGDDDGICDDVDTCVGVIDECDVCNGPGPTNIIIESITILFDSVYAESVDNWFVFEVGADTIFTYQCDPVIPPCGDPISHDGYDYSTVQIGEQCWFSENCRYLPEVSPSSEGSETEPYYYVYGYHGTDVEEAQATANYATYGVLYNWPAVMTEGICPSGWHIPSEGEFTQLTDFLGGESVAGGKMKEAGYDHWNSPNTGATNSSGWTGLPGGVRYSGGFHSIGVDGYWWSASESDYNNGSDSWTRKLSLDFDDVFRNSSNRYYGFSARCVRD